MQTYFLNYLSHYIHNNYNSQRQSDAYEQICLVDTINKHLTKHKHINMKMGKIHNVTRFFDSTFEKCTT